MKQGKHVVHVHKFDNFACIFPQVFQVCLNKMRNTQYNPFNKNLKIWYYTFEFRNYSC